LYHETVPIFRSITQKKEGRFYGKAKDRWIEKNTLPRKQSSSGRQPHHSFAGTLSHKPFSAFGGEILQGFCEKPFAAYGGRIFF
jgi:hypothetical protein